MKFKKHTLITIAGTIWFTIGLLLLVKGLHHIIHSIQTTGHKAGPLVNLVMHIFTGAVIPTTLVVIFFGLLLGYAKGRWALGRAAKRTVKRLYPLQGYIRLTKLYRLHDYLLIGSMIGLSRLMNLISFPKDLHGVIDISIGSALIHGAMIYFVYAIKLKEEPKHT